MLLYYVVKLIHITVILNLTSLLYGLSMTISKIGIQSLILIYAPDSRSNTSMYHCGYLNLLLCISILELCIRI